MAVMWQSTCASSVDTRPVNTYHTTASKTRTATKAPFTKGFRFRNHWRNEKEACGACGTCGVASAAVPGCGVGVGGVELIISFFYFVYIASIWPVARARAARDRL